MCGIVAVFGNVTVNIEKAFKNMLVLDQLRGEHSTGAAFIPKSSASPTVVKAVGAPSELMDTGSFTKAMSGSHRLIIGHNRFATQGKINKANAHPFTCGHITGVHNGSLTGYTGLDGYGQYDVDSHVLYNHISLHGLRSALDNTYGAMALVWWDERAETLNMYRNSQRPLWFATTDDRQAGFVASEPWMITVAAARNHVKVNEPVEIAEHQLVTMSLPKNVYAQTMIKPTVVHMPSRVETNYGFGTGNVSHLTGVPRGNVGGGAAGTSQTTTQPRQNPQGNPLPQGVVGTFTGDFKVINGYSYAHFFEEAIDVSRDFVLSKTLFDNLKVEGGRPVKMGDSFKLNCSGFMRVPQKSDIYWLIQPPSMELVGTNFEYTLKTSGAPEEEEVEQEASPFESGQYLDSRGKDIGKTAWERVYGTCSYCNGDVDHDRPYKFNTGGGIYCEECLSNPVTADILPR